VPSIRSTANAVKRTPFLEYANRYLQETVSTRDISLVPDAVLCESIFLETTV
jgi:hypothetical protein